MRRSAFCVRTASLWIAVLVIAATTANAQFALELTGTFVSPNTSSGTWSIAGDMYGVGSYTSTITGAGPAVGGPATKVRIDTVLSCGTGAINLHSNLFESAPSAATRVFTGTTKIVSASGSYLGLRGDGTTNIVTNVGVFPAIEAWTVNGLIRTLPPLLSSSSSLRKWNQIAIDASGRDHMPTGAHQQLGPCRAARAEAIVHVAMFEAVNAIIPRFNSYVGLPTNYPTTSIDAAIAQAAFDTLSALFSAQTNTIFAPELAATLAEVPDGLRKKRGIALGHAAAAAILQLRANDLSSMPEPRIGIEYIPGPLPGEWRPDPFTNHPLALGGNWPFVTPFAMLAGSQFRAPPPPALDSAAYATAFNEVKALGGDGIVTPTIRTSNETEAGIYWAYDGTPSLCAPPRLYNQIIVQIGRQQCSDVADFARLLALANVAMADAGIAIWDSKYFYKLWRPVTGIRESDPGTGPTGLGDGNAATIGDVTYSPLGAPASNVNGGINFTPPFPAYPSGHAGFGGAIFQVLRRFYGTDNIRFKFVSDELNGVTVGNNGLPRPLSARVFQNLTQAEEENGQSRIYLGIHWSFDKTEGIALGRQVGNWIVDHTLTTVP